MTIRLFEEKDRRSWDGYVSGHCSSGYHLIGWKDVIEKSFSHSTWYLLSEDHDNKINGILPLVQLKSALFGNYMVSLPYFTYGGICAENSEVLDQLISEAANCANRAGAKHIEFRHSEPLNCGLTVKTTKVSMKLALPENEGSLWKGFSSKLRNQVQRPAKEGMVARLGREENLDDFYTIFAENMRDLGTPVYSKKFFANILKSFPDSTWICTICSKDREPVAAGFLLSFKDTLEIPWASSLRRYNRFSPNMLLYWTVLKFACEKKIRFFDFGRSTPGEGTYRFKEQWGAKPSQLYWHYWLQNGQELPQLNPHNPMYRMVINVWKKLPLGITNLIGPSIIKNLP